MEVNGITLRGAAQTDFKNINGAYIIKPMFYEFDLSDHLLSCYSLKPQDHVVDGVTYPSLRKLYVELEDATEYIFATTYLAGWPHWKKMLDSPSLLPHITEWREELDIRLRAKALVRVKQRAESDSKDSLQADKILLSGSWKTPEEKSSVGRPSKEKIRQEAERLFKEQSVFDEDFDRILGSSARN